MTGLLRRWQALESWAAAGKLGVLRALIRDEDQPLPGGSYRGGLPEGWTRSLTHEVAAALAMSVTSAENLIWLAWDLHAQLPAPGTCSPPATSPWPRHGPSARPSARSPTRTPPPPRA
jgi:hypothetical protein